MTTTTQLKSALKVTSRSILCSTTLEAVQLQRGEISADASDHDFTHDLSASKNGLKVRFDSNIASIIPNSAEITFPEDAWHNVAYFIRYWKLDFSQGNVLTDLRDRIRDVDHPHNRPGVVIRYLRTQKYDLNKAEKMFRDSLKWREEHGVDTMVQEFKPPTELTDKYPGAILKGRDKEGDPVFMSRMGVTDVHGMLQKYGHSEMIRYEIFKRESAVCGSWLADWQEESQRPIRHILIIEDLHGLSRKALSSKVASLYGDVMHLDQQHYPDVAKKIVIIRTPAIFRVAWALVKHFFPDYIQRKMEFAGYSNYMKVLEKYLDPAILPDCVHPAGKGEAVPGMPCNFEGGAF